MSHPWTPHKFQKRAMSLMLSQASLGLFLDPGLGKTSTWLGAFTTLKRLGYVDKMLVIAPLKPMYDTWPREIEKYDDFNELTWCFLHGPDKNWHLHNTEADIYFINPEGIQWLVDTCDPSKIADVLCVDESTKFKNSQSKRFKALRRIFPRFDRRWIGTGTPAPNGLEDLFAQVFILDGGNALGSYVTHFRNKWFYTQDWNPYKWLPFPNALEEITAAIAPLVVQISADEELDMPELNVVDRPIKLPPSVMAQIKELEREYITIDEEGNEIIAPTDAVVSIKCRQICNGAVYTNTIQRTGLDDFRVIHDVKLDAMDDLLEEIGEHPVLVVYEFKHDKRRIAMRHLDWPDITGTTGECLRHLVSEFNAGNIPRMLIQSSAAHGLNIQEGCSRMVWFGITWNWEDYKQMLDRLWRQGQCATMVMVYRLLAEGTMEWDMAERLEEKRKLEEKVKQNVKDERIRRDAEQPDPGGSTSSNGEVHSG